MTTKKLIYLIFSLGATLLISSCRFNNNTAENKSANTTTRDRLKQICSTSNKLVFKRYDLSADSSLLQDLNSVVWQTTITDLDKIKKFNDLFVSVKNSGYCCCMKTHYTVTFYEDTTTLGLYYIDTTNVNDKIVLFGQSYQTSYMFKLSELHSIVLDE
jgi:hypothetical protein